jgi:hypothetical protein
MDLHPYDGQERRFRHQDTGDRSVALGIIERLLATPLPSPPPRLLYDLCFYSGGIGVLDRLSLSLEVDEPRGQQIIANLRLKSLAEMLAAQDPLDVEDFRWLVRAEEHPIDEALTVFIGEQKADFQPSLRTPERVWFDAASNVNAWGLVYVEDGWLHYLAYEQG